MSASQNTNPTRSESRTPSVNTPHDSQPAHMSNGRGVVLREGLGARLREAREARKMSLRGLAQRLGLSPSLISQVETGKSQPSISTLFAIVGELEIPVNEVVWEPRGTGSDGASNRRADADTHDTNSPL